MRNSVFAGLTASVLIAGFCYSQAPKPNPVKPDFQGIRPIDAADTVMIEDMTWMEVRDAMKAGKRTVIVATGGIEQNGPYLVAGKHNVVLRGTTDALARKLGDALVAPIIGFVPEGDIDPPGLHMFYPSTVSISEETYRSLVTDICLCYRTHGFEQIILIGDSGGNQDGLKAVAEQLTAKWAGSKTKIVYIPEYYTNMREVAQWVESQGIKQVDEGLHDDYTMTAQMLAVDPTSVRMKERIANGKFRINGVDLSPAEKTIELGKKVIQLRAELTAKAIQTALGKK